MAPLPRMYRDLAPWWPLLSRPADYAEEAEIYARVVEEEAGRPVRTLLELGSGGGNNASHLKARYALTLVDASPAMLEVSRALNPECEHLEGDMRTVRLERTFDAVLIQDAVMYMTTEDDLRAAIATATAHVAPGGVAVLVPDDTVETYRPETLSGGHDGEGRSMRYLQWSHPPQGTTFRTTFVYVLLDGGESLRVEHEEHVLGLFPRATWLRVIRQTGLRARALPYRHSTFDVERDMFVGRTPRP